MSERQAANDQREGRTPRWHRWGKAAGIVSGIVAAIFFGAFLFLVATIWLDASGYACPRGVGGVDARCAGHGKFRRSNPRTNDYEESPPPDVKAKESSSQSSDACKEPRVLEIILSNLEEEAQIDADACSRDAAGVNGRDTYYRETDLSIKVSEISTRHDAKNFYPHLLRCRKLQTATCGNFNRDSPAIARARRWPRFLHPGKRRYARISRSAGRDWEGRADYGQIPPYGLYCRLSCTT